MGGRKPRTPDNGPHLTAGRLTSLYDIGGEAITARPILRDEEAGRLGGALGRALTAEERRGLDQAIRIYAMFRHVEAAPQPHEQKGAFDLVADKAAALLAAIESLPAAARQTVVSATDGPGSWAAFVADVAAVPALMERAKASGDRYADHPDIAARAHWNAVHQFIDSAYTAVGLPLIAPPLAADGTVSDAGCRFMSMLAEMVWDRRADAALWAPDQAADGKLLFAPEGAAARIRHMLSAPKLAENSHP